MFSILIFRYQSPLEAVNSLSGIIIKDRAPTRIGSRMGRPEKAGDRKMKPMVHVLFPIENYGDARRSIVNAGRKSDEYLKDMVAGRPVFSHPGAKGGFRFSWISV